MKKIIGILILVIISFSGFGQTILTPKLEAKIESLISHSIPTMSCQDLQKKQGTPNLYILDAREKDEYAVSHLPKAIWVGYDTFNKNNITKIPKDAVLVIYCSIGYRSEKIGEKLKTLGYTNIYNLYGGIFEWANRKLPLVDNSNKKTHKTHPYNEEWSRFLMDN